MHLPSLYSSWWGFSPTPSARSPPPQGPRSLRPRYLPKSAPRIQSWPLTWGLLCWTSSAKSGSDPAHWAERGCPERLVPETVVHNQCPLVGRRMGAGDWASLAGCKQSGPAGEGIPGARLGAEVSPLWARRFPVCRCQENQGWRGGPERRRTGPLHRWRGWTGAAVFSGATVPLLLHF